MLVWDGEGAIGRWRGHGCRELTRDCQAFRGTLAAKVLICKPADPEAKGLVERFHDYLETLVPARPLLRLAGRFQPAIAGVSGPREHPPAPGAGLPPGGSDRGGSGRRCSPCRRSPPQTGWRASSRLPRDHYIRLDGNDYSVHPAVIGRRIEIRADLGRVRVFCDGRLVAEHARVWAKHQSVHDPSTWRRRRRCAGTGWRSSAPAAEAEVQRRCLADYDTALGAR